MKRKMMMLLAVSLIAIAGCGKGNLQSAPLPEQAYERVCGIASQFDIIDSRMCK